MKKIITSLTLLFAITVAFISCNKEDVVPGLTVSQKTDIVFSAQASEQVTIAVATNQGDWTAVSSQSWCVVTMDVANNKFTVTATPNTSQTASTPATITISANGVAPILINVRQTPQVSQETVVLTKSDAVYLGDQYGLGLDVMFRIDLYNGEFSDPDFQAVQLMGFTAHQAGDSFVLTPGTYSFYEKGSRVSKLLKGYPNSLGCLSYTLVPTSDPDVFDPIYTALGRAGTVDVALVDGIYTITTNITAVDGDTYQPTKDIKVVYTGPITFVDVVTPPPVITGPYVFGDIVESTYTAVAVPSLLDAPGPATWTGKVIPDNSNWKEVFYISNWGGIDTPESELLVPIYLMQGYLWLDATQPVYTDIDGNQVIFCFLQVNKSTNELGLISTYWLQYDKDNKVIDFSYEDDEIYTMVGVGLLNAAGTSISAISEFYQNAKLTLTDVGVARFSGKPSNLKLNHWYDIKTSKTTSKFKIGKSDRPKPITAKKFYQ